MDPNATYDLLVDELQNENWENCVEHAENLCRWLHHGGFAPNRMIIDTWKIPVDDIYLNRLIQQINANLLMETI